MAVNVLPEDKPIIPSLRDGNITTAQASKQASSSTQKSSTNRKPGTWQFTPGFYDDITRMVNGIDPNVWAAKAAGGDMRARDFSNQATRRNMEAQAHQRQANYNPFERAGEIASAQDEDQNRRQMAATNFTAGTGGVLNRTTNAMDVKTQQSIANEERAKADQSRQQADQATGNATAYQSQADQWRVNSSNYNRDRDETWRLSTGDGTEENNTKKDRSVEIEEEKVKKQKSEPEPTEDAPEPSSGNMQAALNYITYGNDPTSGWSKGTKEDYDIGKKTAEYFGLSPVNAKTYYEDTGSMQPIVNGLMAGNPNWKHFGDTYNSVTGRNVDFTSTGNINYNNQANVGVGGYTQAQLQKDSEVESLNSL